MNLHLATGRAVGAASRILLAVCMLALSAGAFAQCTAPQNNNWTTWLQLQEQSGGHAMACHVNVTINGLIGRIENRGGHNGPACLPGAAASAWSSQKALIDQIKPGIIQNGQTYLNGAAGNYVINGTAKGTIGTVVTAYTGSDPKKNRSPCPGNKGYVCTKTRNWVAVVTKQPGGACFLLTAYPN